MTDLDDITLRLAAAAATLDDAIDRYATGGVHFDPPIYASLLTKVAAGAIVTGGVVAVPLVAARTGDNGPSSPAPMHSLATAPTESATETPTVFTLPGTGETFTDEEAWAAIDWLFSLDPHGPDGDLYNHLIIQDRLEKCMSERGFQYHQYPFTPTRPDDGGYALVPPLPSRADVEVAGYAAFHTPGEATVAGPPSSEQAPATTDPDLIDAKAANEESAGDPEWTLALYGDETKVGTCTGEAWAFVEERVGTEAPARYEALAPTIATLTNPLEFSGESLSEALEAWRACMGASDEASPAPYGVDGRYYRPSGTEPSDEEVATALQDLECRRSSGFRDAYRDAMAAGIVNFRFENQARIDDLVEATQRETEALRQLAEELGLLDS